MDELQSQVTQVLQSLETGDALASEALLPLVYDELRRMAQARMAREPAGHTLQPTALVHEVFLRLIGNNNPSWNSRGHFFGAAAEAMRRILIERARRVGRLKHGGGRDREPLSDLASPEGAPIDVLDLDAAIEKLEQLDARKAQILRLRFFAGLGVEQVAEILGRSVTTVKGDWAYARAWLARELDDERKA